MNDTKINDNVEAIFFNMRDDGTYFCDPFRLRSMSGGVDVTMDFTINEMTKLKIFIEETLNEIAKCK